MKRLRDTVGVNEGEPETLEIQLVEGGLASAVTARQDDQRGAPSAVFVAEPRAESIESTCGGRLSG
jgi:hypothetical protein